MNVEPVEGTYLNHVPAIPLTVSQQLGRRLVRTGAFAEGGDGGELPDGSDLTTLDFYDPPTEADQASSSPDGEEG